MFQRFKNVIDRSIAEEQARQKTLADQRTESPAGSSSNSRSPSSTRANSSKDPLAKRKAKKRVPDATNGDNMPNPDPAVFEAAFALDDEEAETRSNTPKPAVPEKDGKPDAEDAEADGDKTVTSEVQNGEKTEQTEASADDSTSKDAATTAGPAELSAEVKAKLRKLDKLEKTYPELLRSYRIAHGRATSIEPFEKALRENTPLTSIKDPEALVEYLQQLNLKGDMVMDEFKRVSTEKDSFKKKFEDSEKELATLKEELLTLKASKAEETPETKADETEDGKKHSEESKRPVSPPVVKSPVSSILGVFSPSQKPQSTDESKDVSEDMFSYDDEIPQLQAEITSKAEEITKLSSEVNTLKEELQVAKENSAGLVESLEKATRELSESRDTSAVQQSLQTQLEARNTEIQSLTEKLEQTNTQLRDLEATLETEKTTAASTSKEHESKLKAKITKNLELDAALKKLTQEKAGLENKVAALTADFEEQTKALNKQLEDATSQTVPALPNEESTEAPSAATAAGGSKKKNKKKKKGGAATASETTPSEVAEAPVASPIGVADTSALQEEITTLKDEIAQKDTQIERLSKQRKTEEDLREEIENMQENLLSIGQEHVEAKDKIKGLEVEKSTLKERIVTLEAEIASFTSSASSNSKVQSEFNSLKTEYDELKIKSSTLTSDLGAAQKLAQDRYKDLTDLREVLTKAQPELKSLRLDSAALKTTKDELAAKQTELRNLEKREKDLKVEVARVQRQASDRETEIKNLSERLSAEAKTRAKLEDEKRVAGRDFRRSEADKVELSAKAEKLAAELEPLRAELESIRPKIATLESSIEALKKEKDNMKEEADLKTAQYNSAQGLLGSMRDQSAELSTQLKESRAQAEGLEEELAEVQKHLQERTREGETMRRMISEVDERTDQKIREMRGRLEAAVEERDRIEDESSTLARRRARESEELRGKVRELEREVKTLGNEKEDLETREREWKRRREELEQVEEKTTAEAEDMRTAVANLRAALDGSEAQVRDAEKQRADLRKLLDESRARYEKLAKDLKTAQNKISSSTSLAAANVGSGRSSMESTRSGTNGAGGPASTQPVDTLYLKTILLQFLEVKDEKVRGQLVPVLGKLLRFDRNDEQKWLNAVQHMSKPGR